VFNNINHGLLPRMITVTILHNQPFMFSLDKLLNKHYLRIRKKQN